MSVISTGIVTVKVITTNATNAFTTTMENGDGLVNTTSLRAAAALGTVVAAVRAALFQN